MWFPVLHISKLNSPQTVSSVTFRLPLKDILLQQNIHREYANSRLTAWWVSTVEQSVQPVPRYRRHHFLYPGNSLHVPLCNFFTFKKHSIYFIEKQNKGMESIPRNVPLTLRYDRTQSSPHRGYRRQVGLNPVTKWWLLWVTTIRITNAKA